MIGSLKTFQSYSCHNAFILFESQFEVFEDEGKHCMDIFLFLNHQCTIRKCDQQLLTDFDVPCCTFEILKFSMKQPFNKRRWSDIVVRSTMRFLRL